MPLSQPRTIFGVHSFTPYNRTTGIPYGELKVLDSSSLSLSGSLIELKSGSQKFPWAVEDGEITSELSLKFSEYPHWLYTLFLGQEPDVANANTTGTISTPRNLVGTSIFDGGVGISAITINTAADLKAGKYLVRAVDATSVHVYLLTDADMGRGHALNYVDDSLRITNLAQTLVPESPFAVAYTGLSFTAAPGLAMTPGDTGIFTVTPPNGGRLSVTVGSSSGQNFPEFGAFVVSQKSSTSGIVMVDCFRCKAIGMPLNFDAKAFSKGDVRIKLFYDPDRDGVFQLDHILPGQA